MTFKGLLRIFYLFTLMSCASGDQREDLQEYYDYVYQDMLKDKNRFDQNTWCIVSDPTFKPLIRQLSHLGDNGTRAEQALEAGSTSSELNKVYKDFINQLRTVGRGDDLNKACQRLLTYKPSVSSNLNEAKILYRTHVLLAEKEIRNILLSQYAIDCPEKVN